MQKFLGKRIDILLIFGLFLTIISPWLFTRPLGLIDFTETGEIGSTIGGITSPITGILGAILIYYALVAQRQANKIQSENNTIQSLLSMLFNLESKCEQLTFICDDGERRKGIEAFNTIASTLYHDRIKPYMGEKADRYKNELTAVVNFGHYLNVVNDAHLIYEFIKSTEIDQFNKTLLLRKFKHLYIIFIERSLRRLSEFYHTTKDQNVKTDKFMIELVNFWEQLKKEGY